MSKTTLEAVLNKPFPVNGPDGIINLTVIAYYPHLKRVRVHYGNRNGIKTYIPYFTNPHGIEFFDYEGTRFYADGIMLGKGARIHG